MVNNQIINLTIDLSFALDFRMKNVKPIFDNYISKNI
jgi:hypothetical protein